MGVFDQNEHIYTTEDISNNKKRPHSDSFSVWYIMLLVIILAFILSGANDSITRLGKPAPTKAGEVPYYGTGHSAPQN